MEAHRSVEGRSQPPRRAARTLAVLTVLSLASASPAAAQAPESVPSCGSRPATLAWEVIRDGKTRAVDLAFRSGYEGAPTKPVRVTVKRDGVQELVWAQINRDQFVYRRRGAETVDFTATYVEDRSRYLGPAPPAPGLPGIPGLPPLPGVVPLPPLPALPALPGVPGLPGLPDLSGETPGAGRFQTDLCTRVLTRRVH